MKRPVTLAALAVVVLAIPGASAALTPPVIREPWTPLPCPEHPKSTIEIEGCLEKAIVQSDRRIDKRVRRIFALLRHRRDRVTFNQGQRAWLRYRRRSCSAEASVYRGGSAEPVAFLSCEKRRNARHIADLVETERILRQG
ncbi:MAG TPA: lysozyme inhibitor LprI family protein [Vicinamibacterales bacterium]|nr:lysozyme inhibitor LprI family protein [Vicinamibacterales bacterium]